MPRLVVRPDFDELDALTQQRVIEAVDDGRVVDDPRLAAAAVTHARRVRRGSRWALAVIALAAPFAVLFAGLVLGDGVTWPLVAVVAGVVVVFAGGFALISTADAREAERRNLALLEEREVRGTPSIGQHVAWTALGLVTAWFVIQGVGLVLFVVAQVVGWDLDAIPTGVLIAATLPAYGIIAGTIHGTMRDRSRGPTDPG